MRFTENIKLELKKHVVSIVITLSMPAIVNKFDILTKDIT